MEPDVMVMGSVSFDRTAIRRARVARALASALVEVGLSILAPPRCAACDAPVAMRVVLCRACAGTVVRAPRDDASLVAAFAYGGAIAQAIQRLKYESRPDLGRPLGDLLAGAVRSAIEEKALARCDVVVPVPLHPKRLAERGFNQAALVARPVARAVGASFAPLALVRTRDTARQASLAKRERGANVEGAFAIRSRSHARAIEGRVVLLVDDVCTTGATLDACARALELAGVARVHRCVIARAERDLSAGAC